MSENTLTLRFWILFDIWFLSFELYAITPSKTLMSLYSNPVGVRTQFDPIC